MKWRALGLGALAAVSGCGQVLGLGDFEDAEPTGGQGGATSATSTSSQGGGGAATTSTTASTGQGGGGAGQGGSGAGGAGGAGGSGGGPVCNEGDTIPCYTGDPALPGHGACAEGTATCLADGTGYGDCEGEVLPIAEDCATPVDDSCDDQINEGCACAPGTMAACYSGAAGTENNAPCKAGIQTCDPSGLGYGPCVGEITPKAEVCEAQLIDEDCDGMANDGCVCIPGTNQACYTGPAGTGNVGICSTGMQSCLPDGSGYGACLGEVTPQMEVCDLQGKDENCDGNKNEICVCQPNTSAACYTGPAGTGGVGICTPGTKTCAQDGLSYGACVGEITPQAEVCEAGLKDEDCDGTPNDGCVCIPGTTASCYSGPAGTQGVGICAPGTKTCAGDGLSYGACMGETVPAAETCSSTLDEDCNAVDCAVWAKGLAVPSVTRRVRTDAQGNIFVLAELSLTSNYGGAALISAGSNDLVVAKYDAAGTHLWSKRFGDAQDQSAYDLAIDGSGNAILVGGFKGTLDFGGGVTITSSSNSNNDVYVAKLDAAGGAVWAKKFGDAAAAQAAVAVGTTSGGDVIVAGDFVGTVNFGGNTLTALGAGTNDTFLARLSAAAGTHVWSARYGDAAQQNVGDLAVDSSDNITLGGTLAGAMVFGATTLTPSGTDMYLTRFDSAGTATCASLLTSGSGDFLLSLAVDSNGNSVATGTYSSSINLGGNTLVSNGGVDVFLMKRSPMCQHVWSKSVGSAGSEYAEEVAVTPAGHTFLVISAQGALDMGGGQLASFGSADAVIARYDANGTHVWSRLFGDQFQQDFPHVATAGVTPVMTFYNTGTVNLGYGNLTGGLVVASFAP